MRSLSSDRRSVDKPVVTLEPSAKIRKSRVSRKRDSVEIFDRLPIPSREDIINSPVHENAPANGATSAYTRPAEVRPGSPMMEDPATELDNELAQRG
jgi:predicted sulfurtransferase